jgi:hypothetical protein
MAQCMDPTCIAGVDWSASWQVSRMAGYRQFQPGIVVS